MVQVSEIAVVVIFALIVFHLAVGGKLIRLSRASVPSGGTLPLREQYAWTPPHPCAVRARGGVQTHRPQNSCSRACLTGAETTADNSGRFAPPPSLDATAFRRDSPKAADQRTAAADVHADLTSAARVHEAIVAIAGRARAASLDSGQSGAACSLRSGECEAGPSWPPVLSG